MAGLSVECDQPFHVRSISMPSSPQPAAARVEEGLQNLRTSVASTSAASEMICSGLRELDHLYASINETLRLPSSQRALVNPNQKRWVERELDQSVKLLDLCNVMHDNLVAMKKHAQDQGLGLRRNDFITENKLQAYGFSSKKAQKEIKNHFRSLKHTERKCTSISAIDKDCDAATVLRMSMDAGDITVLLLQAMFSSLSRSIDSNDCKLSFFQRAMRHRKVASKDGHEYKNEAETLEHLESGIDCVFKRIIINRVSLLNIISL